ncbi:MAG: hypothetical protein ACK2UM_19840 [Anaerolineales bacterium]
MKGKIVGSIEWKGMVSKLMLFVTRWWVGQDDAALTEPALN